MQKGLLPPPPKTLIAISICFKRSFDFYQGLISTKIRQFWDRATLKRASTKVKHARYNGRLNLVTLSP